MYRVEMIPKQSTILDIIGPWTDSGRADNTSDGQFVFESVDDAWVTDGGRVVIRKGETGYHYNLADFYRVKIIEIKDLDRDLFAD